MRIRNKPGRRAKKMEQERLNRIERQREEAQETADQLAADIEADQVERPGLDPEPDPDWAEACEGLEALQDSLEK